jgi:hypothetical protein
MLAETQSRAGHTYDEKEKMPNPSRIRTAGDLANTCHCTDQTTPALLISHRLYFCFFIVAVGYVNHLSETVYRIVEIPFSHLWNNLFLANIYPVLPCIYLLVEKAQCRFNGKTVKDESMYTT